MIRAIYSFANQLAKQYENYCICRKRRAAPGDIIRGKYPSVLANKLKQMNREEAFQRIQAQKFKAKLANMDPYSAEKARLQKEFTNPKSNLSIVEYYERIKMLDERINEMRIKESQKQGRL